MEAFLSELISGWQPAYIDPGSGSMFLQLLLGGVAGAAVALKLFWSRLISFFRPGAGEEIE